ncbi:hypothetical protein [Nostoc sp. CALU 1950]
MTWNSTDLTQTTAKTLIQPSFLLPIAYCLPTQISSEIKVDLPTQC